MYFLIQGGRKAESSEAERQRGRNTVRLKGTTARRQGFKEADRQRDKDTLRGRMAGD